MGDVVGGSGGSGDTDTVRIRSQGRIALFPIFFSHAAPRGTAAARMQYVTRAQYRIVSMDLLRRRPGTRKALRWERENNVVATSERQPRANTWGEIFFLAMAPPAHLTHSPTFHVTHLTTHPPTIQLAHLRHSPTHLPPIDPTHLRRARWPPSQPGCCADQRRGTEHPDNPE